MSTDRPTGTWYRFALNNLGEHTLFNFATQTRCGLDESQGFVQFVFISPREGTDPFVFAYRYPDAEEPDIVIERAFTTQSERHALDYYLDEHTTEEARYLDVQNWHKPIGPTITNWNRPAVLNAHEYVDNPRAQHTDTHPSPQRGRVDTQPTPSVTDAEASVGDSVLRSICRKLEQTDSGLLVDVKLARHRGSFRRNQAATVVRAAVDSDDQNLLQRLFKPRSARLSMGDTVYLLCAIALSDHSFDTVQYHPLSPFETFNEQREATVSPTSMAVADAKTAIKSVEMPTTPALKSLIPFTRPPSGKRTFELTRPEVKQVLTYRSRRR